MENFLVVSVITQRSSGRVLDRNESPTWVIAQSDTLFNRGKENAKIVQECFQLMLSQVVGNTRNISIPHPSHCWGVFSYTELQNSLHLHITVTRILASKKIPFLNILARVSIFHLEALLIHSCLIYQIERSSKFINLFLKNWILIDLWSVHSNLCEFLSLHYFIVNIQKCIPYNKMVNNNPAK